MKRTAVIFVCLIFVLIIAACSKSISSGGQENKPESGTKEETVQPSGEDNPVGVNGNSMEDGTASDEKVSPSGHVPSTEIAQPAEMPSASDSNTDAGGSASSEAEPPSDSLPVSRITRPQAAAPSAEVDRRAAAVRPEAKAKEATSARSVRSEDSRPSVNTRASSK